MKCIFIIPIFHSNHPHMEMLSSHKMLLSPLFPYKPMKSHPFHRSPGARVGLEGLVVPQDLCGGGCGHWRLGHRFQTEAAIEKVDH